MLKPHSHLLPHHRYQLEVIFLFVAGVFLFYPYWLVVQEYGRDMQIFQWYFFIPWLIFYTLYSLKVRNTIPVREQVTPLKRPIGHWVLLGILLIGFHAQEFYPAPLVAIDLAYVVLTIFLADSYWNFRTPAKLTSN